MKVGGGGKGRKKDSKKAINQDRKMRRNLSAKEFDLQSLFELVCTVTVQVYSFELIYEGAIGQPRQTTSLFNPLFHGVGP